jgi:2-hydroxyglutaryl-CoA dehydratase, D-component
MTEAESIAAIDRRLDDPLAGFGGRNDGVGFVGPDVPIEVLLASGRPFAHLPWQATGSATWAQAWLESSFPYWAHSILEQWHAGAFDALETVVFSRADDASQRLYYYVAELQRRGKLRGPRPRIFDIAHIPRESSLAHTQAAVIELMHALDVSAVSLMEGIARANELRQTFARLERARTAHGPLYERFTRAALWSDPRQWVDDLAMPGQAAGRPRILLAGSTPPDGRIHEAVESAGASVIAEAHALAPGRLGAPVETNGEAPERAVARHLRQASIAPRAFLDRAAWIVERAATAGAEAVLIWLTREEEALAWAVPAQQRALALAGISTLVVAAARWQADDDTADRIGEFLRGHVHATA